MTTEANWPYERIEELEHEHEPTWECPVGICTCAETEGGHKDWQFSVMLCEPDGTRMRGARCRVVINGILANEDDPHADSEGWITVACHHSPSSVYIEWAPHDTPRREPYPHRHRYYVDLRKDDPRERTRRRLHNLGFSSRPTLQANIEDFQVEYEYEYVTGNVEDVDDDLVTYHDCAMVPLRERKSRSGGDRNDVRLAAFAPRGEAPVAAPPPGVPGGKAEPQSPPSPPEDKGKAEAGHGTAQPEVRSKMIIGYNYPWAYNKYGLNFGPKSCATVNPTDGKPGGWAKTLPVNLEKLAGLNVRLVRWFIMANCFNYGADPTEVGVPAPPPRHFQSEWRFEPPPKLDDKFIEDFRVALDVFRKFNTKNPKQKIGFLPVWLDFGMALPFRTGGGGGRADLIQDPKKRRHFFDTVLEEFLKASDGHREDIWAWEVMNEPIWTVLSINPLATPKPPAGSLYNSLLGPEIEKLLQEWAYKYHLPQLGKLGANDVWPPWANPQVDRPSLRAFLGEAVDRINAHGFQSTVGHRFFDDMSYYPRGTIPQYHYYAQYYGYQSLAGNLADPAEVPKAAEYPAAFVGEIGTGGHGPLWPELRGADGPVRECTYVRLRALEAKGHRIALIWPSLGGGDSDDALHLGNDGLASLAKYTGGVVPSP